MQKTTLMTKDIIRSNRVRVEGVFISRKTEQIVVPQNLQNNVKNDQVLYPVLTRVETYNNDDDDDDDKKTLTH
jgi:hypothetical protein